MKNRFGSAALVVLTALLFLSAVPARAGWMLSHGATAQASSLAFWESTKIDGYGFDGVVTAGATVPVTIPLPATGDPGYFFEQFKVLYSAGANVHITRIEVWDGGTRIKTKIGAWTGNRNLIFKNKFVYPYTVLHGLSLKMFVTADNAGTTENRRFILNSAGAFIRLGA